MSSMKEKGLERSLGQVAEDSSAVNWKEAKDVTDQKMTGLGLHRPKVSQMQCGRQTEEGAAQGLLPLPGEDEVLNQSLIPRGETLQADELEFFWECCLEPTLGGEIKAKVPVPGLPHPHSSLRPRICRVPRTKTLPSEEALACHGTVWHCQ